MFFGGGFAGQNVYVRRGRQWERQQGESNHQVFFKNSFKKKM
jgi:hypothetical protein